MRKLMSIKMFMKNKMKNILILALLLVFGRTAEANMVLSGFNLNGASSGNKFMINNLHATTDIEFRFTLLKYSDQYAPGDCYVTLLYTESPENNNYDSHPSTIELSPTKYVRKSEFASNGTIFQSVWLPAVLPAYKFSGKIVIRYRFFLSAQNKEVSWYSTTKYDLTIPPSTISNDDYTGAIELSSVAIAGSTKEATYSPQERPLCYSPSQHSMTKDIWYKFIATASNYELRFNNVVFFGHTVGYLYLKTALYNSSLNLIDCYRNNVSSFSNLTIGQTYYIRCWAENGNPDKTVEFNVSLVPRGGNVIKKINFYSVEMGRELIVDYSKDSSIPDSDITFEWSILPGREETANVVVNQSSDSPHRIILEYGNDDYDKSFGVKVRMKRVSTGEVLTDWYIYSGYIYI